MQEGPEASQLCPPAQQGDLELSVLGGGRWKGGCFQECEHDTWLSTWSEIREGFWQEGTREPGERSLKVLPG